MVNGTTGSGVIFTDDDNVWGDGANYNGGSTTSVNAQTAGVDAHYGAEITYDFYKNLFGRNGIDGTGKAVLNRVHYSTHYDNAFWDDTCFCMTYGDGSSYLSLEAPDVVGHEMSHGVCSTTANLTYSGEPGGLNEANSDMFGNMIELYARNRESLPATVANTDACWTVGEQLETSGVPTPLRYMYKPSLDGSSPDAWSSTLGNLDVHFSSGPANRMFFFLSQGASNSSGSNYYSKYTPAGFTGIGPEKAIRIWYRALTTYMTSTTNYAAARTAALHAASDLYGASGPEYAAVSNAFAAINLTVVCGVPMLITPTAVTLAAGGTQQFTASSGCGGGATVTWTCTGGLITTTGLYTAPGLAGTYTVKATNAADTTQSATATVTVTAPTVTISPTAVALAAGASQQFTATVANASNPAVAWTCSGGTVSTTGLYTAPTSGGTYSVTATSKADATRFANATVTVTGPIGYPEAERNDTLATANAVPDLATRITGTLGSTTDQDWFKVKVGAGATLGVAMTGPSGKDYDLYLYNSAGTLLKSSTGSTSTESVSYRNTGAATVYYYIKVKGYNSAYSTTAPYTLTLTR